MGEKQDSFRDDLVGQLPRLWRFGYYLTGSKEAGEDLVQATCERALSNSHQWGGESRLESWLLAIMNSIWKNQLRAQKVRTGKALVDPETHLTYDGAHSMEVRLRTRDVAKAAGQLPDNQRTMLYLVYVEGYSYQETADLMEVPIGTVMSRLARARLFLADQLAGRDLHALQS